ncbi:hypothetical protein [Chryseobacterium sp.]|uniref:hypothetical protein n=1 Tax=Chryseobacterium sp. TaxID=1871047 RepID=UPI002FCAD4F4
MSPTAYIATIEDGVMIVTSKIGNENIGIVTNFAVEGKTLHLNQLHIEGSSGGKVGRENLYKIARDLGRQFKVEEVIIQGGKRTTGKYIGKVPSPKIIKVK